MQTLALHGRVVGTWNRQYPAWVHVTKVPLMDNFLGLGWKFLMFWKFQGNSFEKKYVDDSTDMYVQEINRQMNQSTNKSDEWTTEISSRSWQQQSV